MDNNAINKIKDKIIKKFKMNKRRNLILILGVVGILLILISEIPSKNHIDKDRNERDECVNYVDYLEKETTEIICSINGVGRCKIMITVDESNEKIYAKNNDESNKNGYYSQSDEYVLHKGSDGEIPILIKQNYPDVVGVAIVCDGADNIEVKKQIIDTITSLFSISSSRISVTKYKQ